MVDDSLSGADLISSCPDLFPEQLDKAHRPMIQINDHFFISKI
jgi:hypothetical protein